jgi:FlaA1/EpsC-like NDP-sugar epimerase
MTYIVPRKVPYIVPEDLLSRGSVDIDFSMCLNYISNKTVLITGAGGSIGSGLSHEIIKFRPDTIILLGCGENSIYEIHEKLLTLNYPETKIIPVIANIQDDEKINKVFSRFNPHIVFHVAAHKHVPFMEEYPEEGVKNNVMGTKILADVAMKNNCESFVFVSTDKAVNPTNVLGATKRIAEQIIQLYDNKKGTRFASVRFGNVLGSRGSVMPLFQKQIALGGPITVTSEEITRYFMTISEAVKLIIQAGAFLYQGYQGTFFLDMGVALRIYNLAKRMIELNGLVPGKDIEIKIIGLRQGEKMHEEITRESEEYFVTTHPKIFFIKPATIRSDLNILIDDLIDCASKNKKQMIINKLKILVPEFESTQLEEVGGNKCINSIV